MVDAQIVPLKFHKQLHKQDERVEAVYFPLTAMVSLLVATDGKPQMEMATIGKEGVVGASEILQEQGSMGMTLIQIGGTALRVKAASFQNVIASRPTIQKLLNVSVRESPAPGDTAGPSPFEAITGIRPTRASSCAAATRPTG